MPRIFIFSCCISFLLLPLRWGLHPALNIGEKLKMEKQLKSKSEKKQRSKLRGKLFWEKAERKKC